MKPHQKIPYYTQFNQLATTEILAILSKLSMYVCCVVFLRRLLSLCFFGALADKPPNDKAIPTVAPTAASCADTTSLWVVGFLLSFWVG